MGGVGVPEGLGDQLAGLGGVEVRVEAQLGLACETHDVLAWT